MNTFLSSETHLWLESLSVYHVDGEWFAEIGCADGRILALHVEAGDLSQNEDGWLRVRLVGPGETTGTYRIKLPVTPLESGTAVIDVDRTICHEELR